MPGMIPLWPDCIPPDTVESGERRVESGERRVESEGGEWRVESKGWRVESGEWRVKSGEWRVEGGGRRVEGEGWRGVDAADGRTLPQYHPRPPGTGLLQGPTGEWFLWARYPCIAPRHLKHRCCRWSMHSERRGQTSPPAQRESSLITRPA